MNIDVNIYYDGAAAWFWVTRALTHTPGFVFYQKHPEQIWLWIIKTIKQKQKSKGNNAIAIYPEGIIYRNFINAWTDYFTNILQIQPIFGRWVTIFSQATLKTFPFSFSRPHAVCRSAFNFYVYIYNIFMNICKQKTQQSFDARLGTFKTSASCEIPNIITSMWIVDMDCAMPMPMPNVLRF